MSKKHYKDKKDDHVKLIEYKAVKEENDLIAILGQLLSDKNFEIVGKMFQEYLQSKDKDGQSRLMIAEEGSKQFMESQRNYRINFIRESIYNVVVLTIVLLATVVAGYLQLIEKNLTGYILVAIVTAFLTNAIRRKNPPAEKQ